MAKAKKKAKPRSWVYFIRYGKDGPIKIGCTGDITRRIGELQVGCPYPLELLAMVPGSHELEGQIHATFAYDWMSGEWFKSSDTLLGFIDNLVTHDAQAKAQEQASNPLGHEHAKPSTVHSVEDGLLHWIDQKSK